MAGPQLPNLKGTKKATKGYIKGVQDGTRNDLSKPYPGLKKAKRQSGRSTNSVNA